MKVQEIMERAGVTETGRAIAYIKDGLEEMNLISSENIVKGIVVKTTSTGISFVGEDLFRSVNSSDPFSDLPTSLTAKEHGDTMGPWTVYESENMTNNKFKVRESSVGFANGATSTTGIMQMEIRNNLLGVPTKYAGIWRKFEGLTIGHSYTFSAYINKNDVLGPNNAMRISVGSAAPTGTPILPNTSYGVSVLSGSEESGLETITFTPSATDVWIAIDAYSSDIDNSTFAKTFEVGSATINSTKTIYDSNNGFGNFTTDMKILVDGSSNNDTDESDNSSVGYYTPTSVAAGKIEVTGDTLNDESAGNSITVRGQTLNYMDLIKDKRYYSLPSEAIKITDIRVKNHLNTDDQWRSIPRMIGKPLNTDKDEI
tara:strand:+ start:1842 stop:2954 length:1113 start_codon:yes stop_codon:yes gene_type:complete